MLHVGLGNVKEITSFSAFGITPYFSDNV